MATTKREVAGHWGAWRALVAVPAMLAGLCVVLVAFSGLGRWEPIAVLAWVSCGLATVTRLGERIAVRIGCGFRRLSPSDLALLEPVWSEVLDRCGVRPGSVDLYVQRSVSVNAYAAGGRSLAITIRVLGDYRGSRLDGDLLQAALAHELGHVQTRGSRFSSAALWFATPWRLVCRGALRIGIRLTGRPPVLPILIISTVVCGSAIAGAADHRNWVTVGVLSALVVAGSLAPPVDAALSRASERAADRFAAGAGYAEHLARALSVLDNAPARRSALAAILARHPRVQARIDELRHQSPEETVRPAAEQDEGGTFAGRT